MQGPCDCHNIPWLYYACYVIFDYDFNGLGLLATMKSLRGFLQLESLGIDKGGAIIVDAVWSFLFAEFIIAFKRIGEF